MSYDIRHNGNFVARHDTEEAAKNHAKIMFGDTPPEGETVSVEQSKPFELHCEGGFIDAFDTPEEASACRDKYVGRFKTFSLKSGGEDYALPDSAPAEVEPEVASEATTDPAPPSPPEEVVPVE